MMKNSMRLSQYPSLNGLRAISIILVINGHLNLQYNWFSEKFGMKWLACTFISNSQFGVNVFFVISGFLITSLLDNEEKISGEVSIKRFFIRRVIRIFPAYYFLLLVYLVLQLLKEIHISSDAWISAITYTKYVNWDQDWFTAHAWSLSIEEQFYLVWPLIFRLDRHVRKKIAIAVILFVPFVRIYDYFFQISWINYLTIFTRIDAIATGCLIAIYKESLSKYFSKKMCAILFGITILFLFCLPYLQLIVKRQGFNILAEGLGTTYGTISNVLIAIILLYSVFGPKGIWFRLLNCKLMNKIGILSYSIYLWQQFFLFKSERWFNSIPVNLCMIVVMGCFSYYCIERPFLRLKKRFIVNRNADYFINKTQFPASSPLS